MKLLVLDGNSIVNRSFYGVRPLTTRDGLYTHAVFGFLTTLLRLEGEENPDAVCVTFDLHAPTFRHKADGTYKATRKPMPEELRMQMPVLKEVLDKTGDHDQHLRRIADRCLSADPRKRFRDVPDLKMALSGKSNKRLYMLIIAFLLLMTVILGYLSIKNPML